MIPEQWHQLAAASSVDLALRQLRAADPRLGPHDDELFIGEYVIHLDYVEGIERLRQTLEALAPLDLSIAPVPLASTVDDRSRGALLCRYAACLGEELVVMQEAAPPVPPSPASIERYGADFTRLLDAGFDLDDALHGVFYLLCSSQTGTIVVDGWNGLVPLQAYERPEREAQLAAQLNLLRHR